MEPFRQKKSYLMALWRNLRVQTIAYKRHLCSVVLEKLHIHALIKQFIFFMPLFSVTDEMVFDALYFMKSSLHCYI